MTITTTTSVTELVLAKIVDTLLLEYAYDDMTAVPFFRFKSLVGMDSAVASFPRKVKDSAGTIANETTALTPTEFETTTVDVTCGRIGIAREISETALEDNVLKMSLWAQELAMDAAVLLGEAIDTAATALFASASSGIADSGNDMEIVDLVNAMALQRAKKARGPQVIHLHDGLLKHLQAAQIAATATPWATFYTPNADGTQFGGYFMGAPVWSSSLNPTANTSANRVGAIWSQGQAAPNFCAFGYAVKRLPTTKYDEEILYDTKVSATICRYGVGAIATNFVTSLTFDNEA